MHTHAHSWAHVFACTPVTAHRPLCELAHAHTSWCAHASTPTDSHSMHTCVHTFTGAQAFTCTHMCFHGCSHTHSHTVHTCPSTHVRISGCAHTVSGPRSAFGQRGLSSAIPRRTLWNAGQKDFPKPLCPQRAVPCGLGAAVLFRSHVRGTATHRAGTPRRKPDPATEFVKLLSVGKRGITEGWQEAAQGGETGGSPLA